MLAKVWIPAGQCYYSKNYSKSTSQCYCCGLDSVICSCVLCSCSVQHGHASLAGFGYVYYSFWFYGILLALLVLIGSAYQLFTDATNERYFQGFYVLLFGFIGLFFNTICANKLHLLAVYWSCKTLYFHGF